VDREIRLVEGVLEHADEITGLAGETCARWPTGCRRRELLTIKRDVELPLGLHASPTASPISESSASSTGASSSRAG